MSEENVYTTISGHIIPLGNIDFIGPLERPYEWGFAIWTKSANKIWVGRNDSYSDAYDDRGKILKKFSDYLNSINNGKETNT